MQKQKMEGLSLSSMRLSSSTLAYAIILHMENWKRIYWAKDYEVSDLGRVRSWKVKPPNKKDRSITEPRVLSVKNGSRGYPCVAIWSDDGIKKMPNIHVLVAEAFLGLRPEGMVVCHKNDIKSDSRLVNLEYGTHSQNKQQAIKNRVAPFGENHPQSKLKNNDVQKIKEMLIEGDLTHRQIGDIFGVSRFTISNIKYGKLRKHG